MEKFIVHSGLVAPLDRDNVDTDAIIPKQFLKSIKRTGFGPNAFDEWRYLDVGQPGQDNSNRPLNPDFVLNQPRYKGASILLTRKNFGCGSSRDHRVEFRRYLLQQLLQEWPAADRPDGKPGRQAVQRDLCVQRVQADGRSGASGRADRRRHGISVRSAGLPQVLPAERFRRYRAHAAPRRQDPPVRKRSSAEAAVAE